MASTAQMHPPFKGRDPSGYKIYMENNVNESIRPEDGRGGDAISDRDNGGKVTLDCIESEETNIEEDNQ